MNFDEIIGFEWDEGNKDKNLLKHNVSSAECEEVFYNDAYFAQAAKYSGGEKRYILFGKTDNGRELAVVFTVRRNKIRIISARDQNRKEKKFFHEKQDKETQNNTEVQE